MVCWVQLIINDVRDVFCNVTTRQEQRAQPIIASDMPHSARQEEIILPDLFCVLCNETAANELV